MSGRLILVTGGAGYVGSHTTIELLSAGYDVVVVDSCVNSVEGGENKMPPALIRVQELAKKNFVAFYNLSLNDAAALAEVFSKHQVDAVIHFAALKAVGESVEKPLEYYKNNLAGTLTLLQVMREAGVHRLVFSSSATVYGAPQYLPLDEQHPTGVGLSNPYGRTKYFCEQMLQDLASSGKDWQIVSLRYFNPVGAHPSGRIGENPLGRPNNLMPYVAQVAVGRRKELKVYGDDYDTPDGTGVRDYVHVVDLAEGHVGALDKAFSESHKGYVVYNLGTGSGVSVLEMVEAFRRASGKDIPYRVVGRRDGDLAKFIASSKLAEKELRWRAQRDLKQMCEDAWRWQKQHPDGFVSCKS